MTTRPTDVGQRAADGCVKWRSVCPTEMSSAHDAEHVADKRMRDR
jgi:hypothetical protein